MAMKSFKKIDTKLQFLYRQNAFLSPTLRRLLCNSLIPPSFDYACISRYPLVIQKIRKKYRLIKTNVSVFA